MLIIERSALWSICGREPENDEYRAPSFSIAITSSYRVTTHRLLHRIPEARRLVAQPPVRVPRVDVELPGRGR